MHEVARGQTMTAVEATATAMSITRVANFVVLNWGWRRALVAVSAGALSVLALPPLDAWPVLFVTFPILVWLVDGAAGGRLGGVPGAAIAGWWFGFGYFLAGLYWVGYAFLVDAKTFGWLLPFAVVALPAGMACYTAFGLALARMLWTRGPTRVLALAVALTVAEWLRGHLFGGFPWNLYGYALTGSLMLAQGAALVGIWGLTFAAVAVFASPATLIDDRADTRRPWLPLAVAAVFLAALAGYGAWRLARTPTAFIDDVRLRIMQPNLQQDEKFNYAAKQSVMTRYLELSDRATGPQSSGVRDVTHLIWPESAFPFLLTREPDALAQIAALLPQGAVLITGAVRAPELPPGREFKRVYNSIYVIDHDGSILSIYDKIHLVPFGEYLPFQDFLESLGLMQLTKIPGGFIAGEQRRRPIEVPRAPRMAPFICYEIIFPNEVVPGMDRPGWLINLTNDGWFGISNGPYQHLQQARLRSIEQGLPLVRAANTGVSAVIDPVGRVIKSLPLATQGVIDASLPRRIGPTLYARIGDGAAAVAIGVALVVLVRRRRRQG
jgi:apolipoprotein N-acyltransferase